MTANPNRKITPTLTALAPVAWIGLDWGHDPHAFALEDRSGQRAEGTLKQSAESLHHWLQGLAQRFGGQPLALALEASRGAVLHALLPYSWLTLDPINPVTSARDRKAFTPSGASDDLPDARVWLERVRDHADKLRPLEPPDSQTVKRTGLVEARRDLVDRRTQGLHQLTSLLRSYYPQAVELLGDWDTDLAVDFLSRWPEVIRLKAAQPGGIQRFYYAPH